MLGYFFYKLFGILSIYSYLCFVTIEKDMNTMDLLSKKRQVILDEIQLQQEMLVCWGHLVETKKNIELKISELESSLEQLTEIVTK
jgi:hypothetical protein